VNEGWKEGGIMFAVHSKIPSDAFFLSSAYTWIYVRFFYFHFVSFHIYLIQASQIYLGLWSSIQSSLGGT